MYETVLKRSCMRREPEEGGEERMQRRNTEDIAGWIGVRPKIQSEVRKIAVYNSGKRNQYR